MTLTDAIRAASVPYLSGWAYPASRKVQIRVAYPLDFPGVSLPTPRRAVEQRIDCSTLTASILGRVYPDADWDGDSYGDLQVFADRLPERPDSPIAALVRAGVGARVNNPDGVGWYLVQGWRQADPWRGGHAFLVSPAGAGLTVLESSSLGLVGPRWRSTSLSGLRADYRACLFFARLLP